MDLPIDSPAGAATARDGRHVAPPDAVTTDATLAALLAEAEAVSFDIFDTLFVRPLCDPEDAFDLLGARFGIADFRARRQAAQVRAFARMREEGRGEITLDGIYGCLDRVAVPAAALRRAEYDLELALTRPNPALVPLLHDLLARGRRVVAISDMYLPRDFFEALFDRYRLPRVPFFISADQDATKRDHGALFDIAARALDLPPGRILHIGDNPVSDIAQGRARGFATFHYREAGRPAAPTREGPAASLAAGFPRICPPDPQAGPFHARAFRHGGPAAVGFLDWVAAQAEADGVERVLFVSRDGFVLERIARARAAAAPSDEPSLPAFSYFMGSRTAFTLAGMTEANFAAHLDFLLSGSDGMAPLELLERLDVTPPADHIMDDLGLGRDVVLDRTMRPRARDFLVASRAAILRVARRNRQGLFQYLRACGVRSGMRVALVDIGWHGTTQLALERALDGLMEIDLRGYYFCLADTEDTRRRQEAGTMRALYAADTLPEDRLRAIYDNRLAIELFFSAPHDAVIGYARTPDGTVAPVTDAGRVPEPGLAAIASEMAAGMEAFAARFEAFCREIGFVREPAGTAWPLVDYVASPDAGAMLAGIKNFDAWGSTRNRDLRAEDYRPGAAVPGLATQGQRKRR
jgi:FMN phosphatase YigB (HAD superfamily)